MSSSAETLRRDFGGDVIEPGAAEYETARRSVLRRTWTTVGDELVAHYGAVLDEFSVKCAVGVATPVPASARPHVA